MAKVQGNCEPRFSTLRDILQSNIDSGSELGASLAVEIDGKLVVDLWGGFRDEAKTQTWEEDTVVNVWSTTKSVSSLAALLLVERGLLDLDANVSKYWPEYAANGKENVKVRMIMSHTSGVPAWQQPVVTEDIYDVEKASKGLAEQAPLWEPGTASGYHSMSHGHYISELVRRITGKTLRQFIIDELATPLNADFQLGLKEEDYGRAATVIGPPAPGPDDPPMLMGKYISALFSPGASAELTASKGWRDAEIGACNGHGNGRSIARILSPVALGTVDGKKYLSSETINRIFERQAFGDDLVTGFKIEFGIGFGLPRKDSYWNWTPDDGRVCGWGGWGGSMGIIDTGRRMTIGYGMNKLHQVGMGSPCTKAYVAEIYRVLGVEI